ncbi:hypothetical protein ACZ90_31790 [Streptomyces albus subsp. albus]|nr:hypothetical protein ACZ90_31790 [Streptomyces albus subsp. albus]
MSIDERRADPSAAGALAVVSVLAPVLAGTAAMIFLSVGYLLKAFDPEPALAETMVTAGWVFLAIAVLALLVAVVGLLVTALRRAGQAAEEEEAARAPAVRGRAARPSGRAALRTADFASFVAGSRRAHLREEWAAILAGDPENGITLSPRRRMRYALGFLLAALRMRLRDLTAPLWLPVDWLLSVESRTHGLIAAAVGAQVLYIRHEDGMHALVTEGWGWCAGCGVALRLFAGWLRRVRGIELAAGQGDSGER